MVNFEEQPESNNRIIDDWLVLRKIAEDLNDTEWLKYSDAEIDKSMKTFRGRQNYEPELALLLTFKERTCGKEVIKPKNILLSNKKMDLKTEFDVPLKNSQIQDICRAFGFRIVSHRGYPKVKCDQNHLEKFLKEREL